MTLENVLVMHLEWNLISTDRARCFKQGCKTSYALVKCRVQLTGYFDSYRHYGHQARRVAVSVTICIFISNLYICLYNNIIDPFSTTYIFPSAMLMFLFSRLCFVIWKLFTLKFMMDKVCNSYFHRICDEVYNFYWRICN